MEPVNACATHRRMPVNDFGTLLIPNICVMWQTNVSFIFRKVSDMRYDDYRIDVLAIHHPGPVTSNCS